MQKMKAKKNNAWKWLVLKGGEKVMVDAEDYELLKEKVWVLRKSRKRESQVISMVWNGKKSIIETTYLAREIMKEHQKVVVRKNPVELDFRKSNLIAATRKEKERMREKTKMATTSKYKGVSWRKQSGRWSANICVDNKRMYLGLYLSEEDAAKAYNEAAKKHFGEFAFENKTG